MNRESLRLVLTNVCGHLLHLGLLLLPSFVLTASGGLNLGLILFAISVLIAGISESLFVYRNQFAEGCQNEVLRMDRDALAIHVAQLVGLLLLMTFWFAQIESIFYVTKSTFLIPLGFSMAAAGILLRASAIFALGRNFVSDIRCETAVIETGIYRVLRHPSEYGLLLVAVGAPLMLGAIFTSVFALFTLGPISIWRILRENLFLASLHSPDATKVRRRAYADRFFRS